jgi:general secretion pathway protein A
VGANGPDVQWLASQLAIIGGKVPVSSGIVSYDARLIRQVKDFQAQEGLHPDGIAGVQTLIRINSRVDPGVPRLARSSTMTVAPGKQSASAIDDSHPRLIARVSPPVE